MTRPGAPPPSLRGFPFWDCRPGTEMYAPTPKLDTEKQQPQGRGAPLWGAPQARPRCFYRIFAECRYAPTNRMHQRIFCLFCVQFWHWCIHLGPRSFVDRFPSFRAKSGVPNLRNHSKSIRLNFPMQNAPVNAKNRWMGAQIMHMFVILRPHPKRNLIFPGRINISRIY